MAIALIALYIVSALAEVLGSIVFAVGFWGGDSKLLVAGIDIVIFALVTSEGVKYFCRKTTARFDAYVSALDEPPLPGLTWHWLRSFARGYRLQEVR